MQVLLIPSASQRLATISLLLLLNATSVFALDCQKKDLNQIELNECSKKSLDEETKKINKLYNDYRNTLEDTQKKSLKEVQLSWIKYKDKKCEFETSFYSGGSIAPLIYSECQKDETVKRANEFKEYLNN
jgi:uncharacterized protein YecT (DUF1311 family)